MKGKFYTHREAKELAEYCRERFITLIPEIDMPGHSAAFERTFGCDMQSKRGTEILKQLIEEACEVFEKEEYFHIGTDEVKFTNPNFVPDMVKFVRSKGKKVISWNPGWNYKLSEIDMTQLWSYRGKAQKGIPAIDCRFHYINHFDYFGDIFALYNSRIYDVERGSEDIAGVIVAVWNDRLLKSEQNIVLENSFYPSMLAIAERSWLGGGYEYFNKDGVILSGEDTPQFKEFADFESRMLWHKENNFKGYPFPYVKQTNVKWKITDPFPNDGDLLKQFPPEEGIQDTYTYQGNNYGTRNVTGAGIYLRHVWGNLIPAFYKNPKENHTAYAYTYVYSPVTQEVGALIEFQNYSRSEMDLPPMQGKWDYKESKIWINDTEILPPAWEATHTQKSNEIPMGNENCVARPPIKVTLNKGWNKVFLKLPVGKFSSSQTRLVKWMFTTVFVTPDGNKSVENLVYSPDKIK
jgi:N-acetyl-beta-hexosaminidase